MTSHMRMHVSPHLQYSVIYSVQETRFRDCDGQGLNGMLIRPTIQPVMCLIFGTAYVLDPWTLNKWKGYRENLVPTGRAELS